MHVVGGKESKATSGRGDSDIWSGASMFRGVQQGQIKHTMRSDTR